MSSLIPSNINIQDIIINDGDNDINGDNDIKYDNINDFNINYAQLQNLSLNNLEAASVRQSIYDL